MPQPVPSSGLIATSTRVDGLGDRDRGAPVTAARDVQRAPDRGGPNAPWATTTSRPRKATPFGEFKPVSNSSMSLWADAIDGAIAVAAMTDGRAERDECPCSMQEMPLSVPSLVPPPRWGSLRVLHDGLYSCRKFGDDTSGRGRSGAPPGGVVAVVAALQDAQQRESVEDFVSHFRDDATWVTAGGRRLIGRQEIAEFTQQVLPGAMRDSSATNQVMQVVFVRADVAGQNTQVAA